jgi:predicted transcriptional regulator
MSTDKKILSYLSRASFGQMGRARMMADLNLSDDTVRHALDKLQMRGVLSKRRQGKAVIYSIIKKKQ